MHYDVASGLTDYDVVDVLVASWLDSGAIPESSKRALHVLEADVPLPKDEIPERKKWVHLEISDLAKRQPHLFSQNGKLVIVI